MENERMEAPKISIVIPVYNVRPYLERCMKSAMAQDYPKLEILLIDDGSTDGSGEMCDAYAEKDSRVRVIHKRNGGIADARNAGVACSSGEMLFFLDSDDYLEAGIISRLYLEKRKRNAQLAYCLFRIVGIGSGRESISEERSTEVLSNVEVLRRMLLQKDITSACWAKLYDKVLFQGVSFPSGKLYEDLATTYKVIERVDRAVMVPVAGYNYCVRRGSIQNSAFSPSKLVESQFAKEQKSYLDSRFPELELATADRLVSCCFHELFSIDANSALYAEERRKLMREIRKYRLRLAFGAGTSRKTRVGCLLSYFGFGFCKLLYRMTGMRGKMIG